MKKVKFLILVTVFIDVIGLGIVIPILPFYVERFTASSLVVTSLFAVYSLFSFFSSPVIGALSDRLGRKKMLITSIFSTSLGWIIFAMAPSVLFLFIGRIIDGISAGNFPIAQAYLADISKDDKERSANFGLIGAIFGIAFILGPLIGGVLGSISHSFPFYFVGILAFLNGVFAIFFLPETHKNIDPDAKVSINPFKPIGRALKNKKLVGNYLAWFLFGLAIAAYQAVFSIYGQKVFGFNEVTLGLIFTASGVVIAINQAVVLKHFWLKYFKEPTLELFMIFLLGLGFITIAVPSIIFFFVGVLMATFGQSVLRVVMNSQILAKADPKEKGETLGVISSIAYLSMAISPFFAGALFEKNHSFPFILSAFFMAVAAIVIYRNRKKTRRVRAP